MDEQATRKTLIDKALQTAGWSPIVSYRPGAVYDTAAVTEYETAQGPADYVLFHHGEALAAVEAKKLALGPQNVLVQAQRHARGFAGGPFSFHGFRLPFVYSTNGEIFWFQDLRELQSRSHQVAGFPTFTDDTAVSFVPMAAVDHQRGTISKTIARAYGQVRNFIVLYGERSQCIA